MSRHMPGPSNESSPATEAVVGSRLGYQVPATTTRAPLPMAAVAAQAQAGAGSSASSASSFDIIALLKALRRRWVMALSLGLLTGCVVGAVAWNVVPQAKYTATALLQVMQNTPIVMFEQRQKEADFKVYQKTQTAFLQSDKVLKAALRDPKVAQLSTVREHADNDQVEWLKEQLKILFNSDSEVLQVSLSGDHPADLEILVNSVVDAYMTNVIDQDRRKRMERLEKLRKLWDSYQDSLKSKRTALKALGASAGALDKETLAFLHQSTIDNIHQARMRRIQYVEEIRRLNTALKVAEALRNSPEMANKGDEAVQAPSSVVQREIDHDPNLIKMQQEEAILTGKINRFGKTARIGSDPAILAAKTERANIRRRIEDYTAKLRPQIEASLVQRTVGGDGLNETQTRVQLKQAQTDLAEIEKEIAALQEDAKQQNNNAFDVSREQEEITLATEVARKVGAEIESIEVELTAPERVSVITKADTPRKKDEMKRLRLIGAAAGGAFMFALFGVGFWEFRARRISSVEEVINSLGMTIVGALPAMPERPRRKLGGPTSKSVEERWQKLLVESVDAMRTMLLHASRVESLRVVMVTSAGQGEGKTSLAGHLATSLARAGRNTLLVDCDIRRPTIHRLFDEPIDPGLCELLRGDITAVDAVRQGPTPDLSIVTAGRYDELAQQVLGQDRVRDIFEEWKQQFEFIIIDTPPVLPVADSLFLSQHVDGVLFAILREVSRIPQVQAAYERISRLGARMLGAVVNGAQSDSFNYSSSYYIDPTPGE